MSKSIYFFEFSYFSYFAILLFMYFLYLYCVRIEHVVFSWLMEALSRSCKSNVIFAPIYGVENNCFHEPIEAFISKEITIS